MRLALVLCLLCLAASVSALPTGVLPSPPIASAHEVVSFEVTVDKPTPCYGIENVRLLFLGFLIAIDYDLRDPGTQNCIQVVTPESFVVDGGPFPAGDYPVIVTEHQMLGIVPIGDTQIQGSLEVYGPSFTETRPWSAVKALYR